MTLTITIDLDNAAFADCNYIEVAEILRTLADAIEEGPELRPGTVLTAPMDGNGNTVGTVRVTQ